MSLSAMPANYMTTTSHLIPIESLDPPQLAAAAATVCSKGYIMQLRDTHSDSLLFVRPDMNWLPQPT